MHAGGSVIPPMGGPSPPAGAVPDPGPFIPDPLIEAPLLSDTELLDLFQRTLYDFHRASFPYRPAAVPGQLHAGLPPPPRPGGRVSLRQVATSGCSTGPPRQRHRPRYIGFGF
jgi:hypothetical protein